MSAPQNGAGLEELGRVIAERIDWPRDSVPLRTFNRDLDISELDQLWQELAGPVGPSGPDLIIS